MQIGSAGIGWVWRVDDDGVVGAVVFFHDRANGDWNRSVGLCDIDDRDQSCSSLN